MALSNIGARSSIESLTEQSIEAQQCKLWYDFARTATLEAHDWSFARKRLTLATHTQEPPDGQWAYRYQYPADCVVARIIENPLGYTADAIPFTVEVDSTDNSKSILTDSDDAVLVYTFDVTNPQLYTPLFVDTLAFALAYRVAFTLTGKSTIRDAMRELWMRQIVIASATDGNEEIEKGPREAEWIRGRS
jgi:hypothetical protein